MPRSKIKHPAKAGNEKTAKHGPMECYLCRVAALCGQRRSSTMTAQSEAAQ